MEMMSTLEMPSFTRTDSATRDMQLKLAKADNGKLKATAEDFEAQFLGSMFAEMVSQLQGDGPLGDEGIGAEAFRGMLTDELGRSVARAGGVGIAPVIYGELLKLQTQ